MTEQEMEFARQQVVIACRAYFPDSTIIHDCVVCCNDETQVAIVEINFYRYTTQKIDYDIFGFTFKNIYAIPSLDALLAHIKEIAKNN